MKISIRNDADKQRLIKTINELEGVWYGELEKFSPIRTLKLNRYMHLLFGWMAKDLGYTIDEIKYELKITLGYTTRTKRGTVIPESTASMSNKRAIQFIEDSRKFIQSEFGYIYPDPNEMIANYYELEKKTS